MVWKTALVAGIILLALFGGYAALNTFERSTLEATDDGRICERFYEKCWCLGSVQVMESSPPQYDCSGATYCQDITRTECEEP
jgi:hypothetical protein